MSIPITHSKLVHHNGIDWVQLADNAIIRGVKTLLRKTIHDRQLKYRTECTALDKLRGRKQFKITPNAKGGKTLKFKYFNVPQGDGTYKLMKVV